MPNIPKLLTVSIVLLSGMIAHGHETQVDTRPAGLEGNQFVIGGPQILLPEGFFLLIRKGSQIGAIRFNAIQYGPQTGTGKTVYESYFQANGSGSFQSPMTRKQTGGNDLKPLRGIGRLAVQPGNDRIRVGDWSFRSSSPGTIAMWPYRGSMKDHGYEFAPTSARSVEEIDASDKRLKWFRFDLNLDLVLKVADLPK